MSDLVKFLRARLDEDGEVAQATRRNEQRVPGTDRWFATHGNAITSMAPHRAVAEVEAKRATLADYEYAIQRRDTHTPGTDSYRHYDHRVYALERVVRRDAAIHADHPDYREEWRP